MGHRRQGVDELSRLGIMDGGCVRAGGQQRQRGTRMRRFTAGTRSCQFLERPFVAALGCYYAEEHHRTYIAQSTFFTAPAPPPLYTSSWLFVGRRWKMARDGIVHGSSLAHIPYLLKPNECMPCNLLCPRSSPTW